MINPPVKNAGKPSAETNELRFVLIHHERLKPTSKGQQPVPKGLPRISVTTLTIPGKSDAAQLNHKLVVTHENRRLAALYPSPFVTQRQRRIGDLIRRRETDDSCSPAVAKCRARRATRVRRHFVECGGQYRQRSPFAASSGRQSRMKEPSAPNNRAALNLGTAFALTADDPLLHSHSMKVIPCHPTI